MTGTEGRGLNLLLVDLLLTSPAIIINTPKWGEDGGVLGDGLLGREAANVRWSHGG